MEYGKSNKSIGEILSALTIAVLFLVILLLVVFTARSYQHGADAQYENDTQRVVCAYVATAVKNHTGGEVTPQEFEGCPGLCIEDGDTGFAHKISERQRSAGGIQQDRHPNQPGHRQQDRRDEPVRYQLRLRQSAGDQD